MSNFYSVVQYQNLPGETDFVVTFPFLRKEHVFVYRGENLVSRFTYEWTGPQTIRLNVPLGESEILTFRRFTFKDFRLAEYTDGSILTALELNEVTLQLLYLIQELWDFRQIGEEGVPVPGDPGDGGLPPGLIDDLIAALQDTPIFQTLTQLIPLVDLNAESIIRNALEVHDNWRLDQTRSIQVGANIQQLTEAVETETTARVTQFNMISARVDDNEAFVAEFQEAFAGPDSAVATLVTNLGAKLEISGLDSALAASDFVSGVVTRVTNTENGLVAEGQRIDSLVSLVDDTILNVALAQNTANTAVDRTTALAQTLFILGAATGVDPDNFDPANLAASIENLWEVYADDVAGTAEANAVSTLQAQTRPIFYSDDVNDEPVIPSPVAGTPGFREGFPTGFFNGSIWVRRFNYEGRVTTFSYTWQPNVFNLNGLTGIDPEEPEPYAYLVGGPFPGRWVNQDVQVVGALAQQITNVNIGPDHAAALLRNQLQVQVDDSIAALASQFEIRITPIEVDLEELGDDLEDLEIDLENLGNNIDIQYSLRMNTTVNGQPVIAGYGLGLQATPQGSRSDFIVMADHFSVIRPPASGTLENGQLTGFAPIVPFSVDATTGNVYINGNLFVQDNLFGYQGRLRKVHAGQIVLGQMSGDPQEISPTWNTLVDPNGYRLELNSSTDGFWTGPNRNYLMWAGDGDRNDNNAVFWLDSDGNAFFGGDVLAAGVTGSLMDALPIQYSGPETTAPSNGSWITVGNAIVQANATTARARRPFAIVTVNMYGDNANGGLARLQMRTGSAGNFGSWETVSQHANDMTTFGSAITLSGGTAGTTTGDVQFRVQIAALDGNLPRSNGFSGVLLALPAGTGGNILPDAPAGPSPGGGGSVPVNPDPSPGEPVP